MLIVAIRTLIMYAALLFSVRMMGKSELSKMSAFQLVVVFMIAELAAIPIDSTDASLINGLVAIFTLMFLQVLISYISTKSEGFKTLISGRPSILIEKGKLNVRELSRLRISITDLLEQLRIQDCPSICDVQYAIMESNGQLSVIKKAVDKPVTPKDIDLAVSEGVLPAIIISDGNLYDRNLIYSGVDLVSFENRMRSAGIKDIKKVFLAFCDENKQFHIYLHDSASGPFTKEVKI
ncbi:MAG: DUF421 domain-containing protein [Candidatus Fimisoma sp.]|nr:DUF421 domain-containing protein [Bacillota bacterium]MDY4747835.1 DUF421 domain-containing protein [Candidatus Fimisoma sp.]